MKILAIETSCDETAAAIVEGNKNEGKITILSNVVASSLSEHAKTGGIIPEIAARKQVEYIIPVINQALNAANIVITNGVKQSLKINEIPIDAIAVTYGPGLIGSLLIGVETVKTLAYVWNKPIIPVNHLYGHIYANFITSDNSQLTTDRKMLEVSSKKLAVSFPAIALVVSGGHTDLVLIKKHGELEWLGGTRDDAAGECFDKSARLLGLAYPGGPKISELAKQGNEKAIPFPRPLLGNHNFDFSFSGLKTAVLREVTRQRHPDPEHVEGERSKELAEDTKANICASLEKAIVDVLVKKTILAAEKYNAKSILLGGGVAANQKLRTTFLEKSAEFAFKLFVPPPSLCTDNAAMIGAAAIFNNQQIPWQNVTANPELYFD